MCVVVGVPPQQQIHLANKEEKMGLEHEECGRLDIKGIKVKDHKGLK